MRKLITLLAASAGVLLACTATAGATTVLSLDKVEESGPVLIAPKAELGLYYTQAELKEGSKYVSCNESFHSTGEEMVKNHAATDTIAYKEPVSSDLCATSLKLTSAGNGLRFLNISPPEGIAGTLGLKAAESLTKHIYPATFKGTKEHPLRVKFQETVLNIFPEGGECVWTTTSLTGSHHPVGLSGIESITLSAKKLTLVSASPAGACPTKPSLVVTFIPYVPSDSFNPYVYGFVE